MLFRSTEKTCLIGYLILSPVESVIDSYPSKMAVQDAQSWGNLWNLIKICTWLLAAGAKGCSIWKAIKVSVQKKVQGATLVKYLFLWILSIISESTLACTIIESYLNCLSMDLRNFDFEFFSMTWNIKPWKMKIDKIVVKFNDDKCAYSLMNSDIVHYSTTLKYGIDYQLSFILSLHKWN